MKLIEIQTDKDNTHYINPEYIVHIKQWIGNSWEITFTRGDSIIVKKENLNKILEGIK